MRLPASLASALLVALAAPSLADTPRLHAISFTDHDGETLVSLAIDAAVSPKVQMLPDHRLVLDFDGVLPVLRNHAIEAGTPRLTRIRVGIHGAPPSLTRVVLDLTGPTSYDVTPTPEGLQIDLRSSGAPRRLAAAPTPVAAEPTPTTESPTAAPTATPNPSAAPTATPNPSATPAPRADGAVGPSSSAKPAPTAANADEAASAARPDVEGAIPSGLVTVDFHDADVRTVIDLVANVGGYDVIFTPEVQGTVTVRIVDQPWDHALETVLREKGLRATRHADLILVSPGQVRGATADERE